MASTLYSLPWPRGPMPKGHPFGRVMGQFINEIRIHSGMTQGELAGVLDTTQPALSKLENGLLP